MQCSFVHSLARASVTPKLREKITILQVVNAVAPLDRIRKCPLGLPAYIQLCPLHREIDRADAATEEALLRVALSELNRSTNQMSPRCNRLSRQ